MASLPSSHRKSMSVEIPRVQATELLLDTSSESLGFSKFLKPASRDRGVIDTAAPFESVKEAVSKFGRIVDWKAQKSVTLEKHKGIEDELDTLEKKLLEMKKQAEDAENSKEQVLRDLENTKRLQEELKLDLERERAGESMEKQVAKEIEKGITEDATLTDWKMKLKILELEIDELDERTLLFKNLESELSARNGDGGKEELEEAKKSIKKSEDDVSRLKVAASCLKSELELEMAASTLLRQKKEDASLVLSSLETELARAQTELQQHISKENEIVDSRPGGVIPLPLEKYHSLCERAREAEQAANQRVIAAAEKVNEANASKFRSLKMLEEARRELEEKKEALQKARKASEEANEGKLGAEQELRMWRAENERRRRAHSDCLGVESLQSRSSSSSENENPNDSVEEEDDEQEEEYPAAVPFHHGRSPSAPSMAEIQESDPLNSLAKTTKKKPFFPRVVTFLARKKAQSLK